MFCDLWCLSCIKHSVCWVFCSLSSYSIVKYNVCFFATYSVENVSTPAVWYNSQTSDWIRLLFLFCRVWVPLTALVSWLVLRNPSLKGNCWALRPLLWNAIRNFSQQRYTMSHIKSRKKVQCTAQNMHQTNEWLEKSFGNWYLNIYWVI